MATIPQRELRNDTAAVLRRVEAGETVRITSDGRPVADLVPVERAATYVPLTDGVLAANADQRPGRLTLPAWVERTLRPLPIDERVAPAYARLALAARSTGRDVRRGTSDLLIAATAQTHGLTLLIRDEKLARLPGLDVELV